MRIEKVEAEAFGTLRQQTLEPAPGMTVVYGRNEAGKSTWHAAIYAAICGIRRGKGARKEDRQFKKQHRPWSGDRWSVSCRLVLADERRIEINRDLEGKVDDEAIDVGLGRDVSTEIINDGAPDASRWLGLDRKSFFSTACVQQGDVVAVADNAEELQEHLERAAATAGTDATASRALDAVDTFLSAHVGLDRSNSRRPLRTAINGVESASILLLEARAAHEEYLELDCVARELAQAAEQLTEELTEAKAKQQSNALAELRAKVVRAQTLSSEFPDGPPATAAQQDDLAQRVTESITRWKDLPAAPELSGDSSESLEAQLTSLPEPPDGDTAVASEVRDARDSYLIAVNQLESHGSAVPQESTEVGTDLSASELRDLARVLSANPIPPSPADLDAATTSSAPATIAIGLGAAITVVGLVAVIAGSETVGVVGIIAGVVVAVVGGTLRGRTRAGRPSVEDIAREVRSQEARDRHTEALRSVNRSGLPADPSELYQLADQVDHQNNAGANRAAWESRKERLQIAFETEKSRLEATLADKGATIERDLQESFASYEADCTRRARVAIASGRRQDLEARLEARRGLEARVSDIHDRVESAEMNLQATATACDIETSEPDAIVEQLESWIVDRQKKLKDQYHRIRAWAEMETLLGDGSLADLESRLAAEEGAFASHGYAEEDLEDEDAEALDRRVKEFHEKADDAHSEADAAKGQAFERATQIANVADAEEALTRATSELGRVNKLKSLLTQTRTFLKDAEDKAHRTIAPKLKNDLERWLPVITEGLHAEVAVDIETLEVRIRESDGWRPATLLSHGTAEQVYLLLRIAMVDHLVGDNGPCPLLIDDMTVQSDAGRTVIILEMLKELSKDRQIILFSQEEEVLRWAEQNLSKPLDRLIHLDSEGVPTAM